MTIEHVLAALAVVALWWLSTAAVMRVVWLPESTHRRTFAVASVLALVGAGAVLWAASRPTVTAAYVGFLGALAIWGWHELSFLLGRVTGPRRVGPDPSARGWARFRDATLTVIHHEVALAVTAVAFVAATWGAPNQTATGAFLVLWVMRLSAKLNIFLGVRNISEEFVPPRLRYLLGYFRRARFNALMPVSVLGGVLALLGLAQVAFAAPGYHAVSATLVATLLTLALVEHICLAFPLPDAVLWRWVLRSSTGNAHEDA